MKTMMRWLSGCVLACCGFVLACGGEPIEDVDPDSIPRVATWDSHVAPMLDRYCQGCHSGQTLGGPVEEFDFASYEHTVCEWEDVQEVLFEERSMPPGGAQRPSARDLAILRVWAQRGFLRSDGVPPSFSGDCDELEDDDDD